MSIQCVGTVCGIHYQLQNPRASSKPKTHNKVAKYKLATFTVSCTIAALWISLNVVASFANKLIDCLSRNSGN